MQNCRWHVAFANQALSSFNTQEKYIAYSTYAIKQAYGKQTTKHVIRYYLTSYRNITCV